MLEKPIQSAVYGKDYRDRQLLIDGSPACSMITATHTEIATNRILAFIANRLRQPSFRKYSPPRSFGEWERTDFGSCRRL